MIQKIAGFQSPNNKATFKAGTRTITQDFSEAEEKKKLDKIAAKVKKNEFKYSSSDDYSDSFVSRIEPSTIKVSKDLGNISYESKEGRRSDLMVFTPNRTSPPSHQEILDLLNSKIEKN